jgi:hypothetical protein
MKTLNFKWLATILAFLVLITGCKEKDEKVVSIFVGNFVINEAKLAEAISVPTVQFGNLPLPAGTLITQVVQTALLSAVNCSSLEQSYIELREDNSLYLSCEGLNPLNAGTWEEVSPTSLQLNMNSTAVPTSPAGFVLTVTDIVKVAGVLTGVTSVPLSKAMVAVMIAPLQLTLSPSAPDIFMAKFSIKFTEK